MREQAIDMDTFFWTDGQPDWIPLNDLPALKSKVTVAPPAKRNAPPAPPRPVSRGGGGRPMSIRAAQDATKFGYGSAPTVNMKSAPGAAGGYAAAAVSGFHLFAGWKLFGGDFFSLTVCASVGWCDGGFMICDCSLARVEPGTKS